MPGASCNGLWRRDRLRYATASAQWLVPPGHRHTKLVPPAVVGHGDGATSTLETRVGPAWDILRDQDVDDAVDAPADVVDRAGNAGDAHSRFPSGSAITCTFMPCFLCFPGCAP